ncbi:MAG: translocation/assembly module TamB domain-containing protein [Bacteroidales bacterium]
MILTGLLAFIISVLLLMRDPVMQTVLARVATGYVSKKLNTEVKINKLNIRSFRSVGVYGFLVKDHYLDTLLFTESLDVKFRNLLYLKGQFDLRSVSLDHADFNLIKYKTDDRTNLMLIVEKFKQEDSTKNAGKPISFTLEHLEVTNGHFKHDDQQEIPEFNQVDFNHTELLNVNFIAENINFENDTLSLQIQQVDLYEKSGFRVDSLSCTFWLGPDMLKADNLLVSTPRNKLDLDLLFTFAGFRDFSDFVNQVKIDTEIRPSEVNLTEVGYFAPVMYQMDNRLKIMGKIKGTVNNFKARELKFAFGETTQFRGDVQMNGLPNFEETFNHLSITHLKTSAEDVRNFKIPSGSGDIPLPEILDRFGVVLIEGKFTGFYNDFVSYGSFETKLGNINTDLLLRMNKWNTVEYEGKLASNHFNVGKLFNIENHVKTLDLTANVNGSGVSFDNMKVDMIGTIDSLNFFDNVYNEIVLNGELDKKIFTGSIGIDDELGHLDFSGTLNYREQIPSYNFTANIKDAYLDQINFIKRDSTSRLTTKLTMNFMGDEIDNMQGIITLDSTRYHEDKLDLRMDDFTLSITRDSTKYGIIRLYSDIGDANLEGQFRLREFPENALQIFNTYLDTLVSGIDTMKLQLVDQDFYFDIDLKNTLPLTRLFVPDLEVSENTKIYGGYNSRIQNLFFDGSSPEITYKGIKFKNWYSEFYISNDQVHFTTGSDRVNLTDTLVMDSIQTQIAIKNNNIHYNITWNDAHNYSFSKGDLSGDFKFLGKEKFRFNFKDSQITFADTIWRFQPSNAIVFDSSVITFQNLALESTNQRIGISGKASNDPQDTVYVQFQKFNLSNFDLLLENVDVNLDGIIDGNLKIIDIYQTPFYLTDLFLQNFYFNGERLGDAQIISRWDPREKAFNIHSDFIYTGNIGQRKILGVNGKYYPQRKDNNFDFDITMDNYRIKTLEPFTQSFSSDLRGYATGKLRLTGSTEHPDLSGDIDVNHGSMLIDFVNVRYSFADQLHFQKNRLFWSNMIIYDSIGNQATVSGSFSHEHLKQFYLDMDLKTDQLLGLNTTKGMNSAFYGDAIASGDITIHGPIDDLVMNINVTSKKGTNVKIPVSYGAEVINNDYIVFVDRDQMVIQNDQPEEQIYETNIKGLALNMEMNITNEADIQMFMPYQMGNIRTKGAGNLILNITPTSEMTMDGEYIIDRGSFFFTLQNIINRDFDIKRGSRVTWTGDPYDARINMTAVYKVKTKLGEYGPQEDSATRVPVNCIIALSNRLLDPEIRFRIEFPDLSDDSKQYVYSRLDTTDQALMSQQMISLLVLNSFYQGTGYSGSVGFNTYSLLTNQLNNWLSGISKDFDIGVNYRPGDATASREVEVALSTQLFDDRVLIDGNLGVRDNTNTENTNDIVGEVTVEVKITQDGKLRGKVFNKSNDNLLYKNYAPYTQGVGIFYEFNRLSLRHLFGIRKEEDEKKITQNLTPQQSVSNTTPNSN